MILLRTPARDSKRRDYKKTPHTIVELEWPAFICRTVALRRLDSAFLVTQGPVDFILDAEPGADGAA